MINVGVNMKKWQRSMFTVLNTALLTMADDDATSVASAETEVDLLGDFAPEDLAALFVCNCFCECG